MFVLSPLLWQAGYRMICVVQEPILLSVLYVQWVWLGIHANKLPQHCVFIFCRKSSAGLQYNNLPVLTLNIQPC